MDAPGSTNQNAMHSYDSTQTTIQNEEVQDNIEDSGMTEDNDIIPKPNTESLPCSTDEQDFTSITTRIETNTDTVTATLHSVEKINEDQGPSDVLLQDFMIPEQSTSRIIHENNYENVEDFNKTTDSIATAIQTEKNPVSPQDEMRTEEQMDTNELTSNDLVEANSSKMTSIANTKLSPTSSGSEEMCVIPENEQNEITPMTEQMDTDNMHDEAADCISSEYRNSSNFKKIIALDDDTESNNKSAVSSTSPSEVSENVAATEVAPETQNNENIITDPTNTSNELSVTNISPATKYDENDSVEEPVMTTIESEQCTMVNTNQSSVNSVDDKTEEDNVPNEDLVISSIIGTVKMKSEPEKDKLKDMATDTVDEFLGMMGMDGLNDKEKLSVTVNEKLVDANQASESVSLNDGNEVPSVELKDNVEKKEEEFKSTSSNKSSKKKKSEKSRAQKPCLVCKKVKKCKYNIVRNGSVRHLCDDDCFKVFRAKPSNYLKNEATSDSTNLVELPTVSESASLENEVTPPANAIVSATDSTNATSKVNQAAIPRKPTTRSQKSAGTLEKCAQCSIQRVASGKPFVTWQETLFCDEKCLACYQTKVSGLCEGCKVILQPGSSAKFYLRQGIEVKQFCASACLEQYKAKLKIRTVPTTRKLAKKYCAECKKDLMLDKNSYMAPAGPDGSFIEFCTETCANKFEARPEKEQRSICSSLNQVNEVSLNANQVTTPPANSVGQCVICKKRTIVKHTVRHAGSDKKLCSKTCLSKFQSQISTLHHCEVCHIQLKEVKHIMNFEGLSKNFCSPKCLVHFKMNKVRIVPCGWCGATKSNLDMIERIEMNNKVTLFCSLNCLSLFRVNQQATANTNVKCDECHKIKPAQYHLTMSDASVRNFCSYPCVVNFQSQFSSVNQNSTPASVKTQQPATKASATPNRRPRASKAAANAKIQAVAHDELGNVPVISSVLSLAEQGNSATPVQPQSAAQTAPQAAAQQVTTTQGAQTTTQQIIIQHPEPKKVKNKFIMCKPVTATKGTACKPHMLSKETQTDNKSPTKPILIPVPVPVYIPVPMAMYSVPVPYPLATPVPVPVPCFIPTTKKSTDSIFKQIQEIQEKIPADPFEAELLRMAEACEQAENHCTNTASDDSDHEDSLNKDEKVSEPVSFNQPLVEANQDLLASSGEDILQEAMRLADEMSIPPADLASTLDDTEQNDQFTTLKEDNDVITQKMNRGTKRTRGRSGGRSKKVKTGDPLSDAEPEVAPDAHLHLKFMYGVNAWKHWVNRKNEQLEKAALTNKKIKMFRNDILQCTAEELCRSLCLFIKELRKPNGEEYNADSIYYLCLGIQQYLYENGRVDHIFSDLYYEQFTECLNQVLQRFEVRLNPEGMIVCRLEEEHLWESKQLGAHSPYVLLNTLIYFNTKYFMFRTPEEHLGFSFARIMKQWRKGSSKSGANREALLKYIPPVEGATSGKRKREEPAIYEQVENVDYPLRCPVKLYDFYLSKCPESIKNRTDLFYLMPERSCVPDSPVWFSANALSADIMAKMLNRIRVVKEVQEAHLMDHTNIVWN